MPRASRLTKSTLIVLDHLNELGPMTPQDLMSESGLAPRTVTYALRDLLKFKLARRVPNLLDMRKPLYHIERENIREIEKHIQMWHSGTRALIR